MPHDGHIKSMWRSWLPICSVALMALLLAHSTGMHHFSPLPHDLEPPAALAAVGPAADGHHPSSLGAGTQRSSPAAIDPTLGPPSNLVLTSLDSTIRANWTPSADARTVRYA